jgi:hypothetical protein
LSKLAFFFDTVHPPPRLPKLATALNFVIPPVPACRGTGTDPVPPKTTEYAGDAEEYAQHSAQHYTAFSHRMLNEAAAGPISRSVNWLSGQP